MKKLIVILFLTATACSKSDTLVERSTPVAPASTQAYTLTLRCISSHVETNVVFPKQTAISRPDTVRKVVCDASVYDTIYLPLSIH